MALLIVFFFPLSLAPILDKKSFPLHFIRGYWRHVGLTWHICFIISCPGMIMVIDTVTSPPPRHQCLPCWAPGCVRCDVCVCVWAQPFRTLSWPFNGCKLQGREHVCVRCVSLMWMGGMGGWGVCGWLLTVIPTLDKQACCLCDH